MPSVGMRRTTRVFGVVKGADVARVLRSGRRLWPESGEGKIKRGNDGDEWLKVVNTTGKGDQNGWPRAALKKKQEEDEAMVDTHNDDATETEPKRESASLGEENGRDRMFGIVFTRKRKRGDSKTSDFSAETVIKRGPEDKMFGLHFCRRQRRKMGDSEEGETTARGSITRARLSIVVNLSCGGSCWLSAFLFLVLNYVKRVGLRLKDLSAFVLSEPIHGAYSSRGILFLKGPPSTNVGICKFYAITRSVSLFSVDFSAVPLCFKYLHFGMLLRAMFRSFFLVNNLTDVDSDDDMIDLQLECNLESKQKISCYSSEKEPSNGGATAPSVLEANESALLIGSVRGSLLAGRNTQYKSMLNSRGIQRRRSSLRKRKARNPSLGGVRKTNVTFASDIKQHGMKITTPVSVASSKKNRNLVQSSPGSFKEASSAVVDSVEGLDSSLCHTNILIIESDKCYRVEGAVVTLEMSDSREWLLTVKKDGLTRCTLKAEKVMRPCSSNRFTHVIMFSLDNGWKLEFANRRDWSVFKDLYKECSDRNVPGPVAKFIPVPGVQEVSGYEDSNSVPFHRPTTYMSVNGDELSRVMTRRAPSYDMDSEDEGWLKKFNNEFREELSEDNFEFIIDALEKAYYCNPDDFSDEKCSSNLGLDLGSKEVVEAVYGYWMKKRKQKRLPLLRVFQGHQSKRAPLIPKPLLRKRRSFKRLPSQSGRGKQPSVLQAMAAQQDAWEEQNALHKIEEAKAVAIKSMEVAIFKRKRAQALMENADLATYKATMLTRIAEVAQAAESTDALAAYFLD
ncbi:hypothetical protein L6164_035344 [Bauhinia variegata]|uniref:Uncharacterized protein n=1 Tax=Bauhinia variegata TaxID=167791 RepID=A0ACB9KDN8_BAUVA|nr:hypothetical protein L6164_035344 [Bauhinia variegata]